jgi:DNA-binding phage protein
MLSLPCNLAIDSMKSSEQASAILQAIADEAKQKFGADWQPALVRAYCDIEQAEKSNAKATPVNRRGQILRAFEEGTATLETVCRLAQAVGIEFELIATRKEVKVRRIG